MFLSVVTLEITLFLNFGVIREPQALVEVPFRKTGARECFFGFWRRAVPQKTPVGK